MYFCREGIHHLKNFGELLCGVALVGLKELGDFLLEFNYQSYVVFLGSCCVNARLEASFTN